MNRSLLMLVRMQIRGWVRRQFAGGSIRRTIFGILGGVMFLLWLAAVGVGVIFNKPVDPAETLARLPIYITLFAMLPIIMGTDDRAISFTPAEIDFLFAGPYSRRELVLFKIFKLVLGSVAGGVIFAIWLGRFAVGPLQSLAGATLGLVFINLLTTIIALVRDTLEERMYTIARRIVLVLFFGGIGAVVYTVTRSGTPSFEEFKSVASSTPARVILAPASVFAHVFASRGLAEAAAWSSGCLGMCVAAVLVILRLDRGYMEAALAASQRRQQRIARMTRGVAIDAGKQVRAVRLPELGISGPAGAIIKRQLLTLVRTARGLVIFFVIALGYGYFMSRVAGNTMQAKPDKPQGEIVALLPGLVVILMMLPQMLRFDFRGDIDHIDELKSLPAPSRTITLAELCVPSAVLTVMGWLITAGTAIFVGLPPNTGWIVALAVMPVAALSIGMENFAFLILPTRNFVPGQASMAFGGRRIVMLLTRLGLMVVTGGLVAALGSLAWFLTGSVPITSLACLLAMWIIVGLVVGAVSWAFSRFDVSVDMPT